MCIHFLLTDKFPSLKLDEVEALELIEFDPNVNRHIPGKAF